MRHHIRSMLPVMFAGILCVGLACALLGAWPQYLLDQPLDYMERMMWIVFVALICTFLAHVAWTLPRAREFVDAESGQLDIRRALRPGEAVESFGMTGFMILWMTLAMAGANGLAELYRNSNPAWHDATLWALESTVFDFVQAHAPGPDMVWFLGVLYGLMWPFILFAFSVLVVRRLYDQALLLSMTVLFMFYSRLLVAIAYPTQGPALLHPEQFAFLEGSIAQMTQQVLHGFQHGGVDQNGLYHGLVAMPSLHIGLTALAAWHLAKHWRWTLWLSVPWLLVTWVVTVFLGWHYVVDGLGGIAVAVACHWLAKGLIAIVRGARLPAPVTTTG